MPNPQNPLLGANISVICPIQVKLWPILSQISLPWQPGSVFLKFLRRHSIAWPRKPPIRRKDVGDISYTSRVIADFVSGVGVLYQQHCSMSTVTISTWSILVRHDDNNVLCPWNCHLADSFLKSIYSRKIYVPIGLLVFSVCLQPSLVRGSQFFFVLSPSCKC